MRVSSRESLAGLLKRLRAQAELSQEELAERAGLSYRTISDIETGLRRRPRTATIRLLADALHLDAEPRAVLQRVAQQDGLYLPPALALVGRDEAIARLQTACGNHALVTITGPPGVGKTSLALRFGNDALDGYPGGVAFVALDAIDDAALVLGAIARSLGIDVGDGGPQLRGAVLERLQIGRTLLVLDNIEHVLGAAALVADLLDEAPQACVLATGRCPFDLSTEHELVLAPLSRSAAVSLFVKIAASVVNGYEPDAAERKHIDRICTELDRLPLALELAAMRVRSLSYAQVADRLGDLLQSGSPDRADRHRALDAAISWSYDLLDDEVRAAFVRFAIFPGGATAEDAQAVCGMGPCTVDTLVRQNLLAAEGCASDRRLRMLVTIRAFATARLRASGEFADTARRHAQRMCEIAETLKGSTVESVQACMARFDAEQENFQAALEWALSAHAWETGVRIICALYEPRRIRNQHRDAMQWFKLYVEATAAIADLRLRWRLLLEAIDAFVRYGDLELARRCLAELQEIGPALNDPLAHAWSLQRAAVIDFHGGRRDRARDTFARIISEYGASDDARLLASAHNGLAGCYDNADALIHFELAVRHSMASGNLVGSAQLLANLSSCYVSCGEYERAAKAIDEAIDLASALGHAFACAHAQLNRAQMLLNLGKAQSARADLIQSLEHFGGAQHPMLLAPCLEEAARYFGMTGYEEREASVFALAQRHYGARAPEFLQRVEPDLDRLRASLGERRFHASWELGRMLRTDEVLQMLYEVGARASASSA